MLLKYHQHLHDNFGLGLEKDASSFSQSHSDPNKCDFYGMYGHYKFRCIHKKEQMYRKVMGTNATKPKKIWVPKSEIIPTTNILGRKRSMFKLIPRQWLLMTHDGGNFYVPRPKTS